MRARGLLLGTVVLLVSTLGPAFSATVTNTDDSGPGSLRDAIASAAPGETIDFAGNVTGTITVATELTVGQSLTIQGPGAASLTISGGGAVRVFNVTGGTLSVSGLTIADGLATPNLGGGFLVASTLLLDNCVLEGNRASNGGGVSVSAGASLTVDECTFDTNTTTSVGGGAIINFGTATISNSTFVRNTAPINGGAINTQSAGTTTIVNSTFFDNSSTSLGGALANLGTTLLSSSTAAANEGSSGSVLATASPNVTLDNNVFANNIATVAPGAISPDNSVAGSNNVFFNNTAAGTPDDTNGYGTSNFVLAPAEPLEPLADYGGPTLTMLPRPDGGAVCAGDASLLPGGLTRDQRGLPRTRDLGPTTCLDAGSVQLELVSVPTLGTAGIASLVALLGLVAMLRLRQKL